MKTVLLVDDAAFTRLRCANLLIANGFNVVEATNGREAIEKYQEIGPDAVLMDITMPEMDGLTALKSICERDSKAKVIIVTAMGQKQIVMDAIKSGAKDFLVKPFQPDRILAAVERVLAN